MIDQHKDAICERFIEEFENDLLPILTPRDGSIKTAFKDFYLSYNDQHQIKLYGQLKSSYHTDQHEVAFEEVIFDLHEEDDERLIEILADYLHQDEKVICQRLKRARLLYRNSLAEFLGL